jgi:hypothetical protein
MSSRNVPERHLVVAPFSAPVLEQGERAAVQVVDGLRLRVLDDVANERALRQVVRLFDEVGRRFVAHKCIRRFSVVFRIESA